MTHFCHHQENTEGSHWNEFYVDLGAETYLLIAVSDEGKFKIAFCDDNIAHFTCDQICTGQLKLS